MEPASNPVGPPQDRLLATVLVSHPCPLIRTGLLSVLQRLPGCAVRLCDDERGPWHSPASLQGIAVMIADIDLLALRSSAANRASFQADAVAPKLVLIATRAAPADLPPAIWNDVSACLPLHCSEQEVLDAVRAAIDPARPRSCAQRLRPIGGLPAHALRRVREQIEARLGERIELRELASTAGLSECHFSRAFKQSTGLPPHRYLMLRRIVAAAELIENTARPMTEIALDVGFSDQSHFTRVFAAITGETPRAHRRRYR